MNSNPYSQTGRLNRIRSIGRMLVHRLQEVLDELLAVNTSLLSTQVNVAYGVLRSIISFYFLAMPAAGVELGEVCVRRQGSSEAVWIGLGR